VTSTTYPACNYPSHSLPEGVPSVAWIDRALGGPGYWLCHDCAQKLEAASFKVQRFPSSQPVKAC
jgi:hypothetical protein